ncbi:unnamed protein product (macronuclear) [Paramecium tetraurelia]|uniref:Arp2/3 complex 41 kDa subunit n=1 Tax=Paramecium tetraurelia TaxID=5888 RepID=A0C9A5_PARTE|nr:uncharacterized protein GSPATT00006678001 [Paramecium tetraurelia]CAK67372.1 unnamed protein product [Paramecium tetraurelia]|eukprot:XP_001434769.1 hypothetical protein (macronuclear) [Paramecium tetraurelia strain d4-2]
MTESYLRQQKLVTHTWSPDGQYVALSIKNTSNADIYKVGQLEKIGTWQKVSTLKDASQQINVLSWSVDNKILIGSDDRSVYVYRNVNNTWSKDLVIITNEKAILSGEWAPNGQKCVVGTACHKAFVLFFEEKNNWWHNQQINCFYSSVTACRFHPSGRVLGLGSTDQTFKLVSCVIQDNINSEDQSYNGLFKDIKTFGEILVTINLNGWVNSIDFTQSGKKFAVAAHTGLIKQYSFNDDGSLIVENEDTNATYIKETKPFNKILYLNDSTMVGVGYDRKPVLLNCEPTLKFTSIIEKCLAAEGEVQKSGSIAAAKQMFSGKGQKTEDDKFGHQTAIACINKVNDSLISTSDVNGIINFWRI